MQYAPIELLKVPAEQKVQVVAPAKRTFIVVHHRLAGHQYKRSPLTFPFANFQTAHSIPAESCMQSLS
jgi:hypothetical protein